MGANRSFKLCILHGIVCADVLFPEGLLGVKIVVEFSDINSQRERDFIKACRGEKAWRLPGWE